MMRHISRGSRLAGNNEGVSAVEFALIAPVMCLFLTGFLDFGYWMYVRATASGALESVARSTGVGGASVNPTVFQAAVETQIKKLSPNATFAWSTKAYYDFAGIGKPEKLITDRNSNGSYDPGDCWEDANENGTYDSDSGSAGIGGADDIVYYKLTVTFPPLVNIGGFIPRLGGNHVSTLETIVRRQPFAAQTAPPVRC
jgi:hypothetical protein